MYVCAQCSCRAPAQTRLHIYRAPLPLQSAPAVGRGPRPAGSSVVAAFIGWERVARQRSGPARRHGAPGPGSRALIGASLWPGTGSRGGVAGV